MTNEAIDGVMRIASELSDSNPEMANGIITNLRGLIAGSKATKTESPTTVSGDSMAIQKVAKGSEDLKKALKNVRDAKTLKEFIKLLKGSLGKHHTSSHLATNTEFEKAIKMMEEAAIDAGWFEKNKPDESDDYINDIKHGLESMFNEGFSHEQIKKFQDSLGEYKEEIDEEKKEIHTGSDVSALIKVAYHNPETRGVLLPIIAAKMNKKDMKKPAKKASPKKTLTKTEKKSVEKKPAKKASPKKPAKKASPKKKHHKASDVTLSDAKW